MIIGLEFDTREFERAMADVARESDRADYEILTMNARTYLKSIVYNTPRDTGATRAGFWGAWESLDMSGSPGTRRSRAPFKRKKRGKRMYIPEGTVRDDRKKRGVKEFEFINKTHYVENGKRVYYPYILNARTDFWGKGAEEAAFKFGRAYEKLLRKHGKL
jgi:hypothetical protein